MAREMLLRIVKTKEWKGRFFFPHFGFLRVEVGLKPPAARSILPVGQPILFLADAQARESFWRFDSLEWC